MTGERGVVCWVSWKVYLEVHMEASVQVKVVHVPPYVGESVTDTRSMSFVFNVTCWGAEVQPILKFGGSLPSPSFLKETSFVMAMLTTGPMIQLSAGPLANTTTALCYDLVKGCRVLRGHHLPFQRVYSFPLPCVPSLGVSCMCLAWTSLRYEGVLVHFVCYNRIS